MQMSTDGSYTLSLVDKAICLHSFYCKQQIGTNLFLENSQGFLQQRSNLDVYKLCCKGNSLFIVLQRLLIPCVRSRITVGLCIREFRGQIEENRHWDTCTTSLRDRYNHVTRANLLQSRCMRSLSLI